MTSKPKYSQGYRSNQSYQSKDPEKRRRQLANLRPGRTKKPGAAVTPELIAEAEDDKQAQAGAREGLLAFMRYVWWNPHPFLEGRHTVAVCDRITKALDDFERGQSTFLVIEEPHRHGKSEIVSRALPPYFLGRFRRQSPDIVMSGYGSGLVSSFSRAAQRIIARPEYRALFPSVRVDQNQAAVSSWRIDGSSGEVTCEGLGGTITGRGGHLIVLDDYCKRRAEAESPTYRENVWDSFSNDLMTRRAPVSIVIVAATRWHTDDLIGRIEVAMESDPWFPKFERLKFPAGNAEDGYLFPERFPPEWYESQRATLGRYAAAALLDCEPTVLEGNLFEMDGVQVHDSVEDFPAATYCRFWDPASTAKQRIADDPDYTSGALVGMSWEGDIPHIWVKDIVAGQWEAPERNRRIVRTAERDGAGVRVGVESVGGYKDTYAILCELLGGRRSVHKIRVQKDKVTRASALEPSFESGRIHIVRAKWNDLFFQQFREFPRGRHDDLVDSVAGGYEMAKELTPNLTERQRYHRAYPLAGYGNYTAPPFEEWQSRQHRHDMRMEMEAARERSREAHEAREREKWEASGSELSLDRWLAEERRLEPIREMQEARRINREAAALAAGRAT